ncbi:MAG: T9SS type A sorting domain-containing protein [Bacteroidetes bacterium]|nr:T9SS type A sorting domain-containing protein [Bacteroidota bacterium]
MMTMMMNKISKMLFVAIAAPILFPLVSFAQDGEVILPLYHNKALQQSAKNNLQNSFKTAATDTLKLPFFDDFSTYTVWPNADLWSDSSAFVNFNFPINPPTVGVATFDGLDYEGNPYNNTNVNAIGLCDNLTSKAIDLFADNNGLPYNVSDSLFMTFYYQRKGLGDNPEAADSLVLQFLNPATQTWISVWKVAGATSGDTSFTRVRVSINDLAYRQNGFKFRFRNYGSLTGMLDMWHVDYVFLNKFLPPNYEDIRDFAFVYQGYSLLNDYSAVPWKHFAALPTAQQQGFVKSNADLTLRNNNETNPFPIKVAGTSYDQYGAATAIVGGGGLNSIQIPLNTNLAPPAAINLNTFFTDPTTGDEATFTAVYELGQTSGGIVDDFPENDTLTYKQHFHNYYSFDDGSAELGYGVVGIGAQVAYKFEILQPDTLRAVQFYWAQLGLSVTNQLFKLAVWSGSSSGPAGGPVYQKFNQTPNYVDSINGFYTYLTDPIALSAGTWFFGFIQNNSVILNLGLDVNTPAVPSRKFINTTGSWVNSQLPGMWMIRPVVSSIPIDVGISEPIDGSQISIFPVPASTQLHIQTDFENADEFYTELLDITGRSLIQQQGANSVIDTHAISSGIYFVRIVHSLSGNSYSRKVVISGN